MSWEIVFVVGLLVLAIASFLAEKIPTDQTAISVFVAIVVAGSLPFADKLPDVGEMLKVFSNPAPMTIAAMVILSAALEKCGIIETMASGLERLAKLGFSSDNSGGAARGEKIFPVSASLGASEATFSQTFLAGFSLLGVEADDSPKTEEFHDAPSDVRLRPDSDPSLAERPSGGRPGCRWSHRIQERGLSLSRRLRSDDGCDVVESAHSDLVLAL